MEEKKVGTNILARVVPQIITSLGNTSRSVEGRCSARRHRVLLVHDGRAVFACNHVIMSEVNFYLAIIVDYRAPIFAWLL